MADTLSLRVRWPNGRAVNVHIQARERSGPDRELTEAARPRPHYIGNEALESKDHLLSFLKRLTRTSDDGDLLMAWIFENHMADLYELLDIEGPQPDPVRINLPEDDD